VAAGWNHSLALTDEGDLYSSGYGLNGQLGLGDKESKTQFTYVQSFANKNITSIFAGGNHSWVVIDDAVPINKDRKRDISPVLAREENRSNSNTPLRMT
jgi:alpha-tubulin suppressor-like RCC1 family protein